MGQLQHLLRQMSQLQHLLRQLCRAGNAARRPSQQVVRSELRCSEELTNSRLVAEKARHPKWEEGEGSPDSLCRSPC